MNHSAPTLDTASDFLANSFARLQQAVQLTLANAAEGGDNLQQMDAGFRQQITTLQDENIQLREENHALYSQLEQMREELDELQSRNETIAFKIDRQVQQLELMS